MHNSYPEVLIDTGLLVSLVVNFAVTAEENTQLCGWNQEFTQMEQTTFYKTDCLYQKQTEVDLNPLL